MSVVSVRAVSMITGTRLDFRSSRHTSNPSREGSMTSRRITSNGSLRARSRPSRPSPVVVTRKPAAPHGIKVQVDDRLIEWGGLIPWQGRPWAEAMRDPDLLAMYANPASWPEDPLDEAGRRVLAWAEEATAVHAEGVALGVSHEAPLIAAYLAGRGGDYSAFRMVNVPHLGGVRLLPGPPEIVDPAEALAPFC